jgi:peptide/nickel transport system permease protein
LDEPGSDGGQFGRGQPAHFYYWNCFDLFVCRASALVAVVGTLRDNRELGFWKTSLLSVDGWREIVLPAITLSLFQLTMILRLVRAEMLEVMRTDYIKFARARGLAERSIYFVHALRNTLVPVMTVIGLNIGGLIAYSVITETVFQWPGTGLMFIQAVDFVDVPIMAAI